MSNKLNQIEPLALDTEYTVFDGVLGDVPNLPETFKPVTYAEWEQRKADTHSGEVERLRARIAEVERELDAARARIAEYEGDNKRWHSFETVRAIVKERDEAQADARVFCSALSMFLDREFFPPQDERKIIEKYLNWGTVNGAE